MYTLITKNGTNYRCADAETAWKIFHQKNKPVNVVKQPKKPVKLAPIVTVK